MTSPQPAQRRFPVSRFILLLLLSALLLAAAWFFLRTKPMPVVLGKVERGTVEATVSNTRAGTIKACRRAKLAPAAGGQIARMRVKKGERVVAGQVLLELWNEDLQAQEALAQEQLKTATLHAQEACALDEAAQREAERARQLQQQGFISPQQLDRTLTDAKTRHAACEAAHSEIKQGNSRIAVARTSLTRMVLRAPFNGVVADISGELGEYSTPALPGIPTMAAMDLIDDSCLFVSAPIDEVDAAALKVGQPGRITLDAMKGKQFAGKVKRIAPYVTDLEKQARTVEVEVTFSELPQAEKLLVGYSADVEIVYNAHEGVVRIPAQALMEGKHVLLYRTDGKLEDRPVTTGLANWKYIEIVSGLAEGEQIVLSLDRPGVKAGVRVQPEAGKAETGKPGE
ncbi:MAG: efflux RND transporter periplasmic adaptor subunit [Gallionellaceae bacterium]|nr:efflux RND transporter periplasmic adaptor subunit [Gallionellaceae bacterium]